MPRNYDLLFLNLVGDAVHLHFSLRASQTLDIYEVDGRVWTPDSGSAAESETYEPHEGTT